MFPLAILTAAGAFAGSPAMTAPTAVDSQLNFTDTIVSIGSPNTSDTPGGTILGTGGLKNPIAGTFIAFTLPGTFVRWPRGRRGSADPRTGISRCDRRTDTGDRILIVPRADPDRECCNIKFIREYGNTTRLIETGATPDRSGSAGLAIGSARHDVWS